MSGKKLRALFAFATLLILALLNSKLDFAHAAPSLPIIPGASGFGMNTPAGSGRNLSSPQTTVFKVIQLSSDLKIYNPYITIAGQTAPSPGITLRGAGLRIMSHDVLLQHLKIRVGDSSNGPNPDNRDNLGIEGRSGVYNIVVDHVSLSWSVDENLTLWYEGVQDVTVMNSIISEALHDSLHPKGPHSMGMLVGGENFAAPARVSIFQNLLAHNNERNILYAGDQNSSVFFANNLVYNWGNYGTSFRNGGDVSAVGNAYIHGPDSNGWGSDMMVQNGSSLRVYWVDAMVEGTIYSDPWTIIEGGSGPRVNSPPIWVNGYSPMSSDQVENTVLSYAGARPADRDSVDARVIQSVRNRSGQIIDSPSEVGGWPNPPGVILNSRSLTLPANPNGDSDGDGYTNLEEWLHGYAAQVEGGTPVPIPTFADVPLNHWAHDYIEMLYQEGYVSGCDTNPLRYCPEATMTRSESAVFVERGVHNAAYIPPEPTTQTFEDVSIAAWFAKWSSALWTDGFTSGCGTDPLIFCPEQGHTRTEATVFFLRMLYGPDYVPPKPVGLFNDVPIEFWGAKWIEAAYGAGLIMACDTSPQLLFCPDAPLDRATAAFMMVKAKGLDSP
jgi:hypothetical protein